MCLLTYFPAGVRPDLEALRIGAANNPDGHGYALVTGRRIVVGRSMDPEPLITSFGAERARHPAGPALFHSRWTTHGDTELSNCHPFAVGGDSRTVIAHNGILPAQVQPLGSDPRSDTRIFAEDYLPTAGALHSRRTRRRLGRWMTAANKVVVLTVDPRFGQSAYLLNAHSGIWDNGIWYSNDGYRSAFDDDWFPALAHRGFGSRPVLDCYEGCRLDHDCPWSRCLWDEPDEFVAEPPGAILSPDRQRPNPC